MFSGDEMMDWRCRGVEVGIERERGGEGGKGREGAKVERCC